MAGFLAPVISDINASPTGGVPPVDTSIGDALSGIGSLVSLVGRGLSAKATTETQADRDNKVLRPFIDAAIKIEGLRASGDLTTRQLEVKIRLNMIEAITALPGSSAKVTKALSTIHGREIDVKAPSLSEQADNARVFFFTKDSRGIQLLPQTFVRDDETGELDLEATDRKSLAIFLEFQAQGAKDSVLADELTRLKLVGDINQEGQRQLIDRFVFENTVAVTATIAGLGNIFDLTTDAPAVGISDMIIEVQRAKSQFASALATRAATIGIADERTLYDPGTVLGEFDRALSFLNLLQEQPAILAAIQDSKDNLRVGQELVRIGVTLTPETRAYYGALTLDAKNAEAVQSANDWAKTPKEPTLQGLSPISEGESVIDPRFTEAAEALPEFRQIAVVKDSLEGFYLAEGYTGTDPIVRTDGVRFFTEAVGVILATGKDVPEATFDKIFRPSFIDMFNGITTIDDELTTRFKDVVKEQLITVISQQDTNLKFLIANNFSRQYKNLRIVRSGEKFVLDFGQIIDIDPDNREGVLKKLLLDRGLSLSIEGLVSLVRDIPSPAELAAQRPVVPLVFFDAKKIIRVLKPGLNYLNKAVGVGAAIQSELEERILEFANIISSVETLAKIEVMVNSPEDVAALDVGTPWRHVDETGNVFTGVAE